ncbi:hypothetical protein ACLKA7_004593 [Drosophila subpalustris]
MESKLLKSNEASEARLDNVPMPPRKSCPNQRQKLNGPDTHPTQQPITTSTTTTTTTQLFGHTTNDRWAPVSAFFFGVFIWVAGRLGEGICLCYFWAHSFLLERDFVAARRMSMTMAAV